METIKPEAKKRLKPETVEAMKRIKSEEWDVCEESLSMAAIVLADGKIAATYHLWAEQEVPDMNESFVRVHHKVCTQVQNYHEMKVPLTNCQLAFLGQRIVEEYTDNDEAGLVELDRQFSQMSQEEFSEYLTKNAHWSDEEYEHGSVGFVI